ncbi:MAG: hypothetical protein QXT26_03940 [Thermoproteota archaeon]
MKRWLKCQLIDVKIPLEVAIEAKEAIRLAPGVWRTMDSFISEAIKEHIEKV